MQPKKKTQQVVEVTVPISSGLVFLSAILRIPEKAILRRRCGGAVVVMVGCRLGGDPAGFTLTTHQDWWTMNNDHCLDWIVVALLMAIALLCFACYWVSTIFSIARFWTFVWYPHNAGLFRKGRWPPANKNQTGNSHIDKFDQIIVIPLATLIKPLLPGMSYSILISRCYIIVILLPCCPYPIVTKVPHCCIIMLLPLFSHYFTIPW